MVRLKLTDRMKGVDEKGSSLDRRCISPQRIAQASICQITLGEVKPLILWIDQTLRLKYWQGTTIPGTQGASLQLCVLCMDIGRQIYSCLIPSLIPGHDASEDIFSGGLYKASISSLMKKWEDRGSACPAEHEGRHQEAVLATPLWNTEVIASRSTHLNLCHLYVI